MAARKGQTVVVVSAIIMLLVLFLYFAIFAPKKSDTDIGIVGKAMELACEKGRYSINISLAGKKSFVMSKNINEIRLHGDPSELLYYEFFPPLDDVSWLFWIRDEFPPVIYSFLNETTASDMDGYERFLKDRASSMYGIDRRKVIVVFINRQAGDGKTFSIKGGRDEAVAAKHGFCGDNRLCLKHGNVVKSYELKACERKGIENVQLSSDYFGSIKAAAIKEIVGNKPLAEKLLSFVGADELIRVPYPFYLSSPCYNEEITFYVDDCNCNEIRFPVYDREGKRIGESSWCDTFGIFGTENRRKKKCLFARVEPHYSRSFCYNHDISNQLRYPDGVVEALYLVIFKTNLKSERDKCIKPVDDNSVLLDSRCLDDLAVKMHFNADKIKSKWDAIKQITRVMLAKIDITNVEDSGFMAAWPVDVVVMK